MSHSITTVLFSSEIVHHRGSIFLTFLRTTLQLECFAACDTLST